MTRPLPIGTLSDAPLREGALQPLYDLIEQHIAKGMYPGRKSPSRTRADWCWT